MHELLQLLTGGNRRSIGRSNEVAALVLSDASLFPVLIEGMLSDDPVVRMRAADAAEKVTLERPEYLEPYKVSLLYGIARSTQQEVRWHVAQMAPRLQLDDQERAEAVAILILYLSDRSAIVRTFAMQALADLARQDASLRPQVIATLTSAMADGTPAMRTRGNRLIAELRATDQPHTTTGGSPVPAPAHPVRRITIDERLADDLVRILVCDLAPGVTDFFDRRDDWGDEREVLLRPESLVQELGLPNAAALPWDKLREGQVYVSGEFEVVGRRSSPDYLHARPGRREFLQLDAIPEFRDSSRRTYSELLARS